MLFAEVVAASDEVASTRARSRKIATIADLLRQVDLDEIPVAVGCLTGEPLQGKIGIGWRTVSQLDVPPAGEPTLEILEVDRTLSALAAIAGPGSQAARSATLTALYAQATAPEQWFLGRLLVGELRQGALAGIVTDAVAKAAGVPLAAVRRAAMLAGDLPRVAVVARRDGEDGLAAVRLALLRPVQPMLAQTAETVKDALDLVGGAASVEWKLDGARIQAHRAGDEVRIFTRNLNDVTDRLPGIVALVRSLPVGQVVLDGEAIGWGEGEQPERFQHTMSRFGRRGPGAGAPGAVTPGGTAVPAGVMPGADAPAADAPGADAQGADAPGADVEVAAGSPAGPGADVEVAAGSPAGSGADVEVAAGSPAGPGDLDARFFDILHLDGEDLLDLSLVERLLKLEQVAGPWRIPGRITADPAVAEEVLDRSLATGHEGIMVKAAGSAYEAGRRGGAWRKVKPVKTLDLVVLAAEWGHGRRQGWLSNLHLGARDPDGGPFVMVGKCFKGLTDELLTWQTERLQELAIGEERGRDEWVVRVRPELVVEIALDGVQASTRYPGGVALRFARVRGYRPDKDPTDADTIGTVQAMLQASSGPDRDPEA